MTEQPPTIETTTFTNLPQHDRICLRCNHHWTIRAGRLRDKNERPRQCPNCHNPKWDVPRLYTRKGKRASNVTRSARRRHKKPGEKRLTLRELEAKYFPSNPTPEVQG